MEGSCKECKSLIVNSFKSLEDKSIHKISTNKHFSLIKKGTVLFEEGDILSGVFCIKEGVCKLTKLCSNGKNQIVRFVKTGEVLGLENIISQEPVNLTATALKDLKACFIPKEQIINSFSENIHFSSELIKECYTQLCKSDNIIVDMAQKTVRQRLADSLLYLKETFGTDNEGFIDIKLSREEIGNLIGTATESIIRILSEFSKNNIIETQSKKIKITNIQSLKQISSGIIFHQNTK